MSGVVVEVRVKEGQEIKKGDPVCGKCFSFGRIQLTRLIVSSHSYERYEGELLTSFSHDTVVLTYLVDGVCRHCPSLWPH